MLSSSAPGVGPTKTRGQVGPPTGVRRVFSGHPNWGLNLRLNDKQTLRTKKTLEFFVLHGLTNLGTQNSELSKDFTFLIDAQTGFNQ